MKYPGKASVFYKTTTDHGNRGMSLEEDINVTNEYYREIDKAIIYKKPTPITVSRVEYNSSKEKVIREAYFRIPSTTDYNGIYKGRYIDFEAKETKLKNFPLTNIHKHQIEHLKRIARHGGIAFLIVRFTSLNETYYLSYEDLENYLESVKKSFVSHEYFVSKGHLIKEKYSPRIDYLSVIDEIYFKGD